MPSGTNAALANLLNAFELAQADLPPLFGAWCDGPRALTFNGFVPNQTVVRGLPQYVLGWLLVRHTAVRDFVGRLDAAATMME